MFFCFRLLQNELEKLNRTIHETDMAMEEHRARLSQITKSLSEKNDQRSNFQNSISKIRLDIMELKAIEYPSENEAEILVESTSLLFISFSIPNKHFTVKSANLNSAPN